MSAGAAASISVNGVAVDAAQSPTRELAAIRELLRQRAVELGLIAEGASSETIAAGIEALLEREVVFPQPTEAECRRFYEAHPALSRAGDLVVVRHILFQVLAGSPLERIRSHAEETLARLIASPDDFAECARTLSNCPSGKEGGCLGQIGRGETVPELDQALFAGSGTGILRQLVRTRHGLHIVAIDRRVEGRALPFDTVRELIAQRLAQRVEAVALRQYVRVLSGSASVQGADLDAVAAPLVQ